MDSASSLEELTLTQFEGFVFEGRGRREVKKAPSNPRAHAQRRPGKKEASQRDQEAETIGARAVEQAHREPRWRAPAALDSRPDGDEARLSADCCGSRP